MDPLEEPPRLNIETALVRRLVDSQFPQWVDLRLALIQPGGWDNWTFRLGDEMTVRLPSAERYAAQVAREQEWLPRLADGLPVTIPEPLSMGEPGFGYPWNWSVYRWIEGEPLAEAGDVELPQLAEDLAGFLLALHDCDVRGALGAGKDNFFRGGDLAVYDSETRAALEILDGEIDVAAAERVWEDALSTGWEHDPVWVHGDLSEGNLLVTGGRLRAVIDFGSSAVGDPACDLAPYWTLFDKESREIFREGLGMGEDTWLRGRAWVLWKALKGLAGGGDVKGVVEELLCVG